MLICTSMMPSAQLTVLTDPLKVDYSPSCHYLIYTLLYFCLEAVIHTLLMHMCMTNVTNIHLITRSPQLAHFHFLSSIHSHQYPLSLSTSRCDCIPQALRGWFPLTKGIGLSPRRRRCAQTPFRRHRRWFQGRLLIPPHIITLHHTTTQQQLFRIQGCWNTLCLSIITILTPTYHHPYPRNS